MVELRVTLRKLSTTRDACEEILGSDEDRPVWTSFTFEKHKLSVPSEVLLGVIKDLGECLSKEITRVNDKFKEYGVNPCSADES